ncbi:MAG TPA: SIMPL domain-containing protein [Pyrinomonadaceae bacterium]|nr:SIMPL domain-containing protein [Pyrinomonadaceae bacterium]
MWRSLSSLRAGLVAFALVLAAQVAVSASEVLTVQGRLGRTVEAGGWLIKTSGPKYLILNPEKFRDETWFREDTEVEATGETKSGVISIYQEGTPFEVRTMRQLRGSRVSGGGPAAAVVPGGALQLTRVSVTGEALVTSSPDTAILSLAVVTQNASASEAQAENASRTDAVVRAVRAAAGAGAEVKTGGYSLQPQYAYKEGAAPTITSYIARNSVVVTTSDLTKVGPVIDGASRAGANSVDGLSFTLRRDAEVRAQALVGATRAALDKARVIAEALGGRLVRVVEVQEAGAVRPPIPLQYDRMESLKTMQASAPTTPIEPGTLDTRAQVQLVAEIETKP